MDEQRTCRDVYNITVNGDYQNYPEVKSVSYQNTYNHYHGGQREAADPSEPLSYYITDRELLDKVIALAEQQCTKPNHVKKLVFDELIRAGIHRDLLLSRPFVEALIPHLPKLVCPNVENLQKAFRNNA